MEYLYSGPHNHQKTRIIASAFYKEMEKIRHKRGKGDSLYYLI